MNFPSEVRIFPLAQYVIVDGKSVEWLLEPDQHNFFVLDLRTGADRRVPGQFKVPGRVLFSREGARVLFQRHNGVIVADAVFVESDPTEKVMQFRPETVRWFEPAVDATELKGIWSRGWRQKKFPSRDEKSLVDEPLELIRNRNRWYLDPMDVPKFDELVRRRCLAS